MLFPVREPLGEENRHRTGFRDFPDQLLLSFQIVNLDVLQTGVFPSL